jgi:hypothetical protein
MAKKPKWQRDSDRIAAWMTKERSQAIDNFLEAIDDVDDGMVWELRNQLFDEIQESTAPVKMRKLRDRYLIALYKWVERERKAMISTFPYEVK